MLNAAPLPPPARPRGRRHLATPRAVTALILREMETSYGRSPGGYLWALVEPLGGIALLAACFSVMIRAPALGQNFMLFYASGLLPFTLLLDTANKTANALRFSRPLLAYPAVSFLDALVARWLLSLVTQAAVFALVIASIDTAFGLGLRPDLPALLSALGCAALLAAGIGTLNCLLFGLVPVWERGWQLLSRPLFLVSGVFFLPDRLPAPWADRAMWNPFAQVIDLTRAGLYPGHEAAQASPLYLCGLGLCLLALGLALLGRWQRAILNDE